MKHLRLFETENEYHDVKDTFEYPTVSYTKDSQIVWYMEKPFANLATNFIYENIYVNEADIFRQVYEKYGDCHIDKSTHTLFYYDVETGDELQIDLTQESLYNDYLTKLTMCENEIVPDYIYFHSEEIGLYDSNSYTSCSIYYNMSHDAWRPYGKCYDSTLS